jgi:AcrR family transcriptional regulator
MSPRPYRLGKRQAAADETRAQILTAARELLVAPEGLAGFSVDAVARRADVARMTVYYQFGSKVGLLEALFDDLADHGAINDWLLTALTHADPLTALDASIAAFGRFWTAERLFIRRLHAVAALDPDIAEGDRARHERRRHLMRDIVERIAQRYGQPPEESCDEATDILQTLTSFETFDALAGPSRSPEDVTLVLQRLARLALGMGGAEACDQAGHLRVSATPIGAELASSGQEPSSR